MAKSKYSENIHQAAAVRALKHAMADGLPIRVAGDQNAAKRGAQASSVAKLTGLANGEPDLRVFLPQGRILLFELKTEHGRLSKDQIEAHEQLRALGHSVMVVKREEPLDTALDICRRVAGEFDIEELENLEKCAEKATEELLTALGRI
jgi:hypothetical protein